MRLHTYICVSDIRWRALYSETRLHVFFSSSPFSIHGIMSVSILVQIACVFQSTLALCVLQSQYHIAEIAISEPRSQALKSLRQGWVHHIIYPSLLAWHAILRAAIWQAKWLVMLGVIGIQYESPRRPR